MRTFLALLLVVLCAPVAHADPVHTEPLRLRLHWEDWVARFDGQVQRYADDTYQVSGKVSGRCREYPGTVRLESGLDGVPWNSSSWLTCDRDPVPYDTGRLPIKQGQLVMAQLCLAGPTASKCQHPVPTDTWK